MNCLAKGTLCDTNESAQSQCISTDSCKLQRGFKCQGELVFCILAAPHCCFIPLPLKWRVWNKCKKRKGGGGEVVSCFTVFSAPLELNYVGTVTCSLSARRWQIPVAEFERCVVKHCSFALDLQILYGMPCANHRFPQSCVGSSRFSPAVSAAACSQIQLPASPCTL